MLVNVVELTSRTNIDIAKEEKFLKCFACWNSPSKTYKRTLWQLTNAPLVFSRLNDLHLCTLFCKKFILRK